LLSKQLYMLTGATSSIFSVKNEFKRGPNAINSDKMYANHSFYDVNVERPSQTMVPMGKLTKATFPMRI